MTLFPTKHSQIALPHQCGTKQRSAFGCPSSNAVVSFESKVLFPPSRLPHQPLVDGYIFEFHSHDACSAVNTQLRPQIILWWWYTIYITALLFRQLITHVRWSLDRSWDLLITKLSLKYNKYYIAMINHPPDDKTPSLESIAWNYDHVTLYTCPITTHILTTTHSATDSKDIMTSTTTHTTTHSLHDTKFRENSTIKLSDFYVILKTLTGDIIHAPIKCLSSAYTQLKETKQIRYNIIKHQMLLRIENDKSEEGQIHRMIIVIVMKNMKIFDPKNINKHISGKYDNSRG